MSYIEKTLIPGETVLYRARLHWIVLARHVTVGSILALVGVGATVWLLARPSRTEPNADVALLVAAVALFAAGLIVLAIGILNRRATEIAVTNKRVLIKSGFFSRSTTEIFLTKIESVVVDETFLGKSIGFGCVTIRGTGGTPERFERIGNPLEFRRQVQAQIEGGSAQARTA